MEEKTSILVVEDEEKIRSALTDFLEFHNFEVTEVADGLKAERMAAEKRFDLILLDLMLPKISGEQLCSKWRHDGLHQDIDPPRAQPDYHRRQQPQDFFETFIEDIEDRPEPVAYSLQRR